MVHLLTSGSIVGFPSLHFVSDMHFVVLKKFSDNKGSRKGRAQGNDGTAAPRDSRLPPSSFTGGLT